MGASAAVGAGGEYDDWALLGFISVVILVGKRNQIYSTMTDNINKM